VKHGADVGAIAAFIATGGLAGLALGLGQLFPSHAGQINSVALIVVAIAGLIRTIANPTPTNVIQLTDRTTGSTVSVRTVEAPALPKESPNGTP